MIGSVKRPPITISCECGESRPVPYGEAWECGECGRRWDTSRIPVAEYEAFLRRMNRYRNEVLALAVIALGTFVPLIVFVNGKFVFVAAVVAFAWILLYQPWWRRRARRALASAPRWELHPD
jgi:hypothetical protein